MLYRKRTKAQFDALPDDVKKEYTADGDNYVLNVEDDPSSDTRTDAERSRRRAAEKRADDAEKARDEALATAAAKTTDTKTLEDQYKVKLDAEKAKATEAKKAFDTFRREQIINKVAGEMAAGLTDKAPKLLAKEIAGRLDVDLSDDEPTLFVKDAKGKRSAMTQDELRKEFLDNKEYAGIITSTKASGGHTKQPRSDGNGNPGNRGQEHNHSDPSVPLHQQPLSRVIDRVNARRAAQGKEAIEVNHNGAE